jgi:hypothetical protein
MRHARGPGLRIKSGVTAIRQDAIRQPAGSDDKAPHRRGPVSPQMRPRDA